MRAGYVPDKQVERSDHDHECSHNRKKTAMTISAALVVIVAGLLIAAFLSSTIGVIVAVVGVVGLILAALSGNRRSVSL